MRVRMPNKHIEPQLKAFVRINRVAKGMLSELLAEDTENISLINGKLRDQVQATLKPLALKMLLECLESRQGAEEKHYGFEWEDGKAQMIPQSKHRTAAALQFLSSHKIMREILESPVVQERNKIEWLYDNTVGRLEKVTPYLLSEEKALEAWRQAYAHLGNAEQNPYAMAEAVSRKKAEEFCKKYEQLQHKPMEPEDKKLLSDLAHLGYMIASRKLFLQLTMQMESYEEEPTVAAVKVPKELESAFTGSARTYMRFGSPRPLEYKSQVPNLAMTYYADALNSTMLGNLQQHISPWTADNCILQRVHSELMAKAYYQIYKPQRETPQRIPYDSGLLDAVPGDEAQKLNRATLLGFRTDLAPDHIALLKKAIDQEPNLAEFLDKPSTREALQIHRIDKSLVNLVLHHTIATELVRVAQGWDPETVHERNGHGDDRALALSLIDPILDEQVVYHNALLKENYLEIGRKPFFKERLFQAYLAELPDTERAKWNNFRKVRAVVSANRTTPETFPLNLPTGWRAIREYQDQVSGATMTDYELDRGDSAAIICLEKGAKFQSALDAVEKLLNLHEEPRVQAGGVEGVRISEQNYKEFRSSCLKPVTIARMRFYTSFDMNETLGILKGSTEDPSLENVIEALKPCFILKYNEKYSRVKPAEMVRVKYRTPTGEKQNPCWDASRYVCKLDDVELEERHEDPEWGLILIEGEKKAALLAQMVLEKGLKYHVLALPGVWMGLDRKKSLVPEIADFNMRKDGLSRECFVWFDNDKAYKAGVTHAMIETAVALRKAGAEVFIPNLPFGKKIKGADDFAYEKCRKGEEVEYGPLLEILHNSVRVPEKPQAGKYPSPEDERDINRVFEDAEHVHALQEAWRKKPTLDLSDPTFRELFLLQARWVMTKEFQSGERVALDAYDKLSPEERAVLVNRMANENGSLELLKQKCSKIPSFETGMTLEEYRQNSRDQVTRPETDELVFSELLA